MRNGNYNPDLLKKVLSYKVILLIIFDNIKALCWTTPKLYGFEKFAFFFKRI